MSLVVRQIKSGVRFKHGANIHSVSRGHVVRKQAAKRIRLDRKVYGRNPYKGRML